MIDPCFALQTALHDHLVAAPAVIDLVPAAHIRAGSTRPDRFPTVIIGEGRTIMHGRASPSLFVAGIFLDLHIWTDEADTPGRAKAIGAALARALMDWPAADGFSFDEFKHVRTVWPRDPEGPDYGHGVLSVEAVIRWSI